MTPRKTPEVPVTDRERAPLMVVGIGASAGGLKALQALVEAVGTDSGMAFVVILHLDPLRESRMRELLQDRAGIPVTEVSGPTAVAGDHIYIIPPGHDLAMQGMQLELRERGERSEHAPVDLFFRTLAESCGADAAGVILSGTGADGTAGIRHIREGGGVTIAQSPDESEYDGMPASAISTGLIDLVLRASQIPRELLRLRRRALSPGERAASAAGAEAGLAQVFAILRDTTGHDFSLYKRATVLRRLERRLRFNDMSTVEEYLPLLQASRSEGNALLRDLLISVSSFFRDPDAFEAFAAMTPSLFEGKGRDDAVRVWVVGCATGEEVYSIAMLLAEHAATLQEPPRVQLFATDIDEHGYAWARAGLYTPAAVASMSPERLRRFFTKEPGGYRVARSLREQVLFAGHNVLHDPPFSRMDLVSCRNLLIYLQPEAQARVLETFHFALKPAGWLFLGASDSVGDAGLFTSPAGSTQRLFRRNASPYRVMPRLSAADPQPGPGSSAKADGAGAAADPPGQRFSYGAVHVRMLEQYAPASLVVNERLDVVHLSSGAGRFLHLGEGVPSHSVLGLAREDLRRFLRTALHYAFEDGSPTTRRIPLNVDGRPQQVSVHVRPPPDGSAPERFALIVFDAGDDNGAPAAAPAEHGEAHRPAQRELEEELQRTRDMLESTSAAHDRTVAELQTVNEELQSINEEQRAAAEELETSREEIQSINEELITINQEHQSTIEELKRTNADLQNLIESTEIGTIFLDRAMRLRRFTPTAAAFFNFVAADHGRPLAHITHRLEYDGLLADVASVLSTHERIEREVRSDTGVSYIVRINPYRSLEGGHDGAVLTFFDNTAQHRVGKELREAKLAAEAANLAKGRFLATLSHEFRTPLNAMIGYADVLCLDGALNAAQEQKLERIRAGGRHLTAMIEEILRFAGLDDGRVEVESAPEDARSIAEEAGALVEPEANVRGLSFVLDLPDVPVRLLTDAAKARQILINLCGNAVKYTEAGEVRVSVGGDAERVHFAVRDTGIGIAVEQQARIFERFWQVDGSSTRAAGGMGIGLAVAREYARLLGGDVDVESEPGSGSTFHLWLPVGAVNAAAVSAATPGIVDELKSPLSGARSSTTTEEYAVTDPLHPARDRVNDAAFFAAGNPGKVDRNV